MREIKKEFEMERKIVFALIFGILLAVIVGFFLMTGTNRSGNNNLPLPEFQPGIWDQPVIRPPNNSSAGLFDYPFMYEYDLNESTGFDTIYKKYYRPTLVIAPGKNATIVLNVTSYSRHTIIVSLANADNLPAEGVGYVNPGSIILEPGTSKHMALELNAAQNATRSEVSGDLEEGENKLPVGLWLESDDWKIGQGFYLKLMP